MLKIILISIVLIIIFFISYYFIYKETLFDLLVGKKSRRSAVSLSALPLENRSIQPNGYNNTANIHNNIRNQELTDIPLLITQYYKIPNYLENDFPTQG